MYTVIRSYSGAPTLADELKSRSKDVEALRRELAEAW